MVTWLYTHPCVLCGALDDITMHHTFGEVKRNPKGVRLSFNQISKGSTGALIAEIEKCVTLCKTCHKEVHRFNPHAQPHFDIQFTHAQLQRVYSELYNSMYTRETYPMPTTQVVVSLPQGFDSFQELIKRKERRTHVYNNCNNCVSEL